MKNPTVTLLFSLFSLISTQNYYTVSNATTLMHSEKLAALPPNNTEAFQLIRSLITSDKHAAKDIRDLLDEVNEIRRKIAADKNISNSHMVHWNTSLSVMAKLQDCFDADEFSREEDGLQGYKITNDFGEFWNMWENSESIPFWIDGLTNPKTSMIGCAKRDCSWGDVKYEVICVMQGDAQETIHGVPGSGCPYGTNDNGLCNNRGISKASAILSVILMFILVN